MDYVYIGKLVNTHGIKGEVRIISDFPYKERVFKSGVKLYIDEYHEEVTISSYRSHKNYDMCVFKEYNYINDVLKFKGSKVYARREDILDSTEYTYEDLIGMKCIYNNEIIGTVSDVLDNKAHKLLVINDKYIPMIPNFVNEVNVSNKEIILDNLEGLL